jgi:DNA (cytosine-5)-methyltransferase 1
MTTITTIFSGGEGVGAGARMAGLIHLGGIEIDNDIAQVARDNNFDTITADVLTVDPALLPVPDILHASPVCTRASVANSNGEESELDIDAAKKTAEFITVMRPRIFTLENVYPYRHFQSFKLICDALRQTGYSFDYWHLNSADYGVPQTRRRLVLIAKLDGGMNRIKKPVPTHHNPKDYDSRQMSLFAPSTKSWVGWYQAIEDLIPFLPESEFAPWQLERLPDEIKESICWLNPNTNTNGDGYRAISQPSTTVPIFGVEQARAFILDGKLNETTHLTKRDGEKPVFAVTTSHNNRDVRAYIVDQLNGSREISTNRNDGEPMFTVSIYSTKHSQPRAYLFGNNANDTSGADIYIGKDDPAQTVRTPGGGRVRRAWLSQGRVVKMTPHALARFQSFPEWYRFPDENSLAMKVIGNAVPPLLAYHMLRVALL